MVGYREAEQHGWGCWARPCGGAVGTLLNGVQRVCSINSVPSDTQRVSESVCGGRCPCLIHLACGGSAPRQGTYICTESHSGTLSSSDQSSTASCGGATRGGCVYGAHAPHLLASQMLATSCDNQCPVQEGCCRQRGSTHCMKCSVLLSLILCRRRCAQFRTVGVHNSAPSFSRICYLLSSSEGGELSHKRLNVRQPIGPDGQLQAAAKTKEKPPRVEKVEPGTVNKKRSTEVGKGGGGRGKGGREAHKEADEGEAMCYKWNITWHRGRLRLVCIASTGYKGVLSASLTAPLLLYRKGICR
eukprot:365723-Chlamydomonas_euryale.AAC.4